MDVHANRVVDEAARTAANIRGLYGEHTHVTVYVHSLNAWHQILAVEGHKEVPFRCEVLVDSELCKDKASVVLSYRRPRSASA